MGTPKVLVVDDAAFMRTLILNAVKAAGYNDVYLAEDGYQAIDIASNIKPEFITLDISMPGIDGIEVIQKVLSVSPASKIIMVTAVTAQKILKKAIENGAVDFIAKPFTPEEIEEVLKKHS